MKKLKGMWKDLNKPSKLFVIAVAFILAMVLINYIV